MTAPVLSFRHVFGLKADVSSPLLYVDELTVLFAAGHQIVLQNVHTKQQRFIPATDMNGPSGVTSICALALSPNRRYLAVAEEGLSCPFLSIFDLRTLKRRRAFGSPSMSQAALATGAATFRALQSLSFSADNRHLAAVSGGTTEAVVMEWQWQKEQLTACGLIRQITAAHSLSYSPNDGATLLLTGEGGFAFLNVDWDSATISPLTPPSRGRADMKGNGLRFSSFTVTETSEGEEEVDWASLDVTAHCWMEGGGGGGGGGGGSGHCVLGTRQGQLLLVEEKEGRVVNHWGVHDGGGGGGGGPLDGLGSSNPPQSSSTSTSSTFSASVVPSASSFHPAKAVHSLCAFAGGLVVGCDGGVVQVYHHHHPLSSIPPTAQLPNGDGVSRVSSVFSSSRPSTSSSSLSSFPLSLSVCHALPHHSSPVIHVILSPSHADLVAVTETQQSFRITRPLQCGPALNSGDGHGHGLPSSIPSSISPLLSLHHSGAITGLSLCVRKPLAATCGVDRSIRLWNVLTLDCDLVAFFPECPLSVSFHPSGLHLLVGFSDKLRLCNVLMHEIRPYREWPIKNCMEVAFSHGGHAFACVNGTLIQVYDSYTGEQLAVFRGHTGQVRSLSWSKDDLRLVSAGVDGAVYQRKLGSAGRLHELVQKGCKFSCALVTEQDRMYAVGDDRMLKEIVDRSVHKTLDAGCVLTFIAVDHSPHTNKLIAGTDNGVLRSFAFPLTGIVKVHTKQQQRSSASPSLVQLNAPIASVSVPLSLSV